ncbi:pyridoxal phosphate-dependent aminotransferase [Fulvivirgaceae bacterium LMO-SS25]
MEESATLAMAAKARELKSQGVNVISLSLGEPDFATPDHIREAAKDAVDEGKWFTYPPVAGYPDLRQAIAKKLREENGLESQAENIVVSAGAKQSIANVMMCLLNPGDEVVVFSPFWVSYAEIIKLAEGTPVYIHGGVEQGFKATAAQLEAAITDKTKAIIYSSPCNPTGAVFSKDELKAIAQVMSKHPNVFIIADEIYEHINFSGKHISIGTFPEVKDQVITVNGFSKGFAMTGWRVGYVSAPVSIAKACEKIQGQFTSGICSIAQRAALAAISGDLSPTIAMGKVYKERKKLVMDLLSEIPNIKMNDPEGAFYAFPDVSHYFGKSDGTVTINNADELALYILKEAHVSVVTGGAFGSPECIRISFAASNDDLIDALKRIKNLLATLK